MILVILAFQKSRNFWFSQEKHCIIKKTNKQKDRLPEEEVELPKVLMQRLINSQVSKGYNPLYGEFQN